VQAGFQDGCAVVMKVVCGGEGGEEMEAVEEVEEVVEVEVVEKVGVGGGDWVKKIWELEIPASYLRATPLGEGWKVKVEGGRWKVKR